MYSNFRNISVWTVLAELSFFMLIFGGGLAADLGLPARFYFFYVPILPLTIYLIYRFHSINLFIFGFLALTGISGIYMVLKGQNTLSGFFKIYFSIAWLYPFSYYLIKYFRFDISRLFGLYLKGSYFVIFFAFVQLFSFLIGFRAGYDFRWFLLTIEKAIIVPGVSFRAHSILLEPSNYALALTPAMFAALCRMIYPKKYNHLLNKSQALYVLGGFLISVSSSGFMALLFSMLILALQKVSLFKTIFGLLITCGLLVLGYSASEDFRTRLENSASLFVNSETSLGGIDVSSFTLFNHAIISYNNVREHAFFGSGFGSHPVAFEKYSLTKDISIGESYLAEVELNKEDANSMTFRLLSETGFFGFFVFVYSLFKFRVKVADNYGNINWLVSNAFIVFFFLVLLRNGHYFLNGISVFFFMHYFNYLDSKNLNKRNLQAPNISLN